MSASISTSKTISFRHRRRISVSLDPSLIYLKSSHQAVGLPTPRYLRRVWHSDSGRGIREEGSRSRSPWRALPPALFCWSSSWPWRQPLGPPRPGPRPPPPPTGEGDQGSPLCWRTRNHRLCIRFLATPSTKCGARSAAAGISRRPRPLAVICHKLTDGRTHDN